MYSMHASDLKVWTAQGRLAGSMFRLESMDIGQMSELRIRNGATSPTVRGLTYIWSMAGNLANFSRANV
jgi:hypothetical protein